MLRLPPRRNEWFRGRDGEWEFQKLQNEVLTDEISFQDRLFAGETLASHEWLNTSGPSITGDAINGDSDGVTFTITKSGSSTLKVVTSDGRTLLCPVLWVGLDVSPISDYG